MAKIIIPELNSINSKSLKKLDHSEQESVVGGRKIRNNFSNLQLARNISVANNIAIIIAPFATSVTVNQVNAVNQQNTQISQNLIQFGLLSPIDLAR